MATNIKVRGVERAKKDFIQWVNSTDKSKDSFFDAISSSAITLLAVNTPKDTGRLSSSWVEIGRDSDSVIIGVTDDQEDKLQFVVLGTRYIQPNNFMSDVDAVIDSLISSLTVDTLTQSHKYWRPIQGRTANISKTVGLSGTRYNSRRSFGRAGLARPQKGFKRLSVRIGRRRRVGSSILSKKVNIG